MLLMNSERFGVLLAESLEVGGNRTVTSDNIDKCNFYFQHCDNYY